MPKFNRKLTIFVVIATVVAPVIFAKAEAGNSPTSTVCGALASIMPCIGNKTTTSTTLKTTGNQPNTTSSSQNSSSSTASTTPKQSFFGSLFSFIFGSSKTTTNGYQTATIIEGFGGKVNRAKDAIILVQVPGSSDIYRIMGGKKFLIPTQVNNAVFNSYGFNKADIVPMSKEKLNTYPRVKLVTVVGTSSKTVYYLTEVGMLRLIPNKKIFDSYADVDHDISVINAVEFSLYPKNQYIFNEETLVLGQPRQNFENQNLGGRVPRVFLISNLTKQEVSYQQLAVWDVTDSMIAPVNQMEFDFYKTLKSSAVLLNSSTPPQDNSPNNSSQKISTQYN